MSKRTMCLLSFALTLGLLSTGNAVVIDSFETGVDSWEIMDPAETLVQATVGVTDGAFSMQRNFTSGWHEIDLGGISVDDLNANDIIEVDVTTSVTAEQMGWWLQQVIVLQGGNAAGSYYLQSEVVDVASPDGTLTTTTVSFEYSSLLADGPITDWAKIRLINNTGPGPNGILYYDNLRIVSAAPPPVFDVIDSFETGVDSWEIMDPAETLVQADIGVTDGAFSMQRNFTSGWHEIDLGGISVDTLNANDILEVDVTTSVTAEQMGWWLQQVIVLQGGNAAGSYYLQSEVVDVASPDGTLTTTTVSFEYSSLLADGPITDWAKIRLINNTGPGPNGILYYDNLRAVSLAPPAETTTITISDFESGLNGWFTDQWVAGTVSLSPTGATGGSAQAMLSKVPAGGKTFAR